VGACLLVFWATVVLPPPPPTAPTEALSLFSTTKTVPPEVRACTPQLAADPPAPPIEVSSVSPVYVPPIKVPTSDPSHATMVMPTQVPMLYVSIEALLTLPDSDPRQAPTVMPTQVPVVSAPIEAQPALGVPNPAVPYCTPFVPVSVQWKPQLAGSRKDKLHRLIARSTRQFESSESWEEFISKCRDRHDDLHPNIKHLPQ
jgi:hypothetical protein